MSTLIVGLGSPNGLDQLGWLILDEIEKSKTRPEFTLFKSKSDGSDWFHEIKHHQQIIFIDAALSNESIGSIIEISVHEINDSPEKIKSSTHSIHLNDSILLAHNLNLLKVPVRILGVSIGHNNTFDQINLDTKGIIPELIQIITSEK